MNACLARGVNKFTIEHPLTTVRESLQKGFSGFSEPLLFVKGKSRSVCQRRSPMSGGRSGFRHWADRAAEISCFTFCAEGRRGFELLLPLEWRHIHWERVSDASHRYAILAEADFMISD
jgi:hypothetical protein